MQDTSLPIPIWLQNVNTDITIASLFTDDEVADGSVVEIACTLSPQVEKDDPSFTAVVSLWLQMTCDSDSSATILSTSKTTVAYKDDDNLYTSLSLYWMGTVTPTTAGDSC